MLFIKSPLKTRSVLSLFCAFLSLTIGNHALAQEKSILVVAIKGIESGKEEWGPTIDYLNRSLPEYTFSLVPVIPTETEKIKTLVKEGFVDFVITQPAIYVDLEMSLGVSRILTMVKNGGYSEFGSAIVVRADSNIRSVADLENKVIAGVAELGFGGWLLGLKEMLDQGFDPSEKAKKVVFLGTQPRQIQALLDKEVDAIVIRTGILEKLSSEGEIILSDFRVLSLKQYPDFAFKVSTELYPEWALASTRKASHELSKQVALAMLSIEPTHPAAVAANYMEWTFPYDYQPVHELLKSLQVGPYQNFGQSNLPAVFRKYWPTITLFLFSIIIVFIVILNANRKAAKLARTDSLTGLHNRRAFLEMGKHVDDEARRYDRYYSIIMLDLDNFKELNDQFGHQSGDEALIACATVIKNIIRSVDIAARFGGEEFILLLPETRRSQGISLAERLREAFAEYSIGEGADSVTLTASFGVAEFNENFQTLEQVINDADAAMYRAKNEGRNRVIAGDSIRKKQRIQTSA